MRAKFVYESLENILKPKSEEEILKAMNDSGLSPDGLLEKSIRKGFLRGVQLALEKGADVDSWGGWPIQQASANGQIEIVKELLKAGADVHVMNEMPLQWASANGNLEVVKILLEAGANVHVSNDYILRHALSNGHEEVANLLKQYM